MNEFTFSDGEEICLYKDGKVQKFPSEFIERYKRTAENMERSREWKRSESAVFRGEGVRASGDLSFDSRVTGVFLTGEGSEVVYTFYIDNASGVYKKDLADAKLIESHIVNSNGQQFYGGCLAAGEKLFATGVKRNYYNCDIALFDLSTGEYKTVTDGDTLDEDPYFSEETTDVIYYSSRGAGRNASGEFVEFSPAEIYRLDLNRMDLEKVSPDDGMSYFKPVLHGGKLYCIKAPAKLKKENVFISVIMVPVRILQAIWNFLEMFVRAFTGKSMTGGGANPAKGREYDSRKIVIAGNLIDVEKEIKKNSSKKDADYGLVPQSWKLIELGSGEVIKSGVADFDIAEDGTVIVTNGRRIFAVKDGKTEKLCNTDACFSVRCRRKGSPRQTSLFGF